MTISSDDLYDMSDDELEEAFKAAKASEGEEDFETGDDQEPEVLDDEPDTDTDEGLEDEGENEGSDEEAEAEDADQGESDEVDESSEEDEGKEESEDGDTGEEEEEKPKPVTKRTYTANGKKYEFDDEEIKEMFPRIFGQAMDYTKKLQTIQPWRRTIDAIEQAKLQHEDVNLMIDVLKGDKDAIAEVLKRTGVDTLDIDTEESKYVQNEYGRSEYELEIADVIDTIKGDAEYATTHKVLTKDWDAASWSVLSSDPKKIQQLHTDVKSGMFAQLQPEAEKLKLYDGGSKSDLDYYMAAAKAHFEKQENSMALQRAEQEREREAEKSTQTRVSNVQRSKQQRDAAKDNANRRKAAAPTGRATARATVTDYLSASDEEFEEWYKRLNDG